MSKGKVADEVRDLVPVEPAQQALAGLVQGVLGQLPGSWTNLPAKTLEQQRLLMACRQGECESADTHINKALDVYGVLMHAASYVAEGTGEVTEGLRTVLVMVDGHRISFGSLGVVQSLVMITQMFGPGPWPRGLKLTLRQRQLKNGHRLYYLEV